MLRKHGHAATREFFDAQLAPCPMSMISSVLTPSMPSAAAGGEFQLAHRAWAMDELKAEHDLLAAAFGFRTELLKRDEQRGVVAPSFHGGLWSPVGRGSTCCAICAASLGAALDAGAVIHSRGQVVAAGRRVHVLSTAAGEVRAKRVLLATNAYSDDSVPRWIGGRFLPALSGC